MVKYVFDQSIGRITQEVSKGFGKTLEEAFKAKGYCIKSQEWTILSYLFRYKELSQNELVKPTGRDKVAVKRMLDKLETEGYIEREDSLIDRRYNNVRLSDKGAKLYKKLVKITEATITPIFETIDEQDLQNCISVLIQLNKQLNS